MYAVRTYFFMCWNNAGLIQSKSPDYSVFSLLQTCVIFFKFRSKDLTFPSRVRLKHLPRYFLMSAALSFINFRL